jgi:hypothetical protein
LWPHPPQQQATIATSHHHTTTETIKGPLLHGSALQTVAGMIMIDAIVCLDVIVFGCSGGNYSNVRAFNDNAMIEMTINRRPG